MAIGVDTSKWKPRRLKGTRSNSFINLLGFGVVSVGIAYGVFLQYSSFTEKQRVSFEQYYQDPDEVIERKVLIASGLTAASSEQLREWRKEDDDLSKV